MIDTAQSVLAIALAAVIFIRAVCVLHGTAPHKHRHPLVFIGFGYAYVTMGAGAVFIAIEIVTHADLGTLPLWLMLAGSCGLIAFDRRLLRCWTVTDCPAERGKPR